MSDEREMKDQAANADEMADVEAHRKIHNTEPEAKDDVEAHMKNHKGADGTTDDDNDVEAHMKATKQ